MTRRTKYKTSASNINPGSLSQTSQCLIGKQHNSFDKMQRKEFFCCSMHQLKRSWISQLAINLHKNIKLLFYTGHLLIKGQKNFFSTQKREREKEFRTTFITVFKRVAAASAPAFIDSFPPFPLLLDKKCSKICRLLPIYSVQKTFEYHNFNTILTKGPIMYLRLNKEFEPNIYIFGQH